MVHFDLRRSISSASVSFRQRPARVFSVIGILSYPLENSSEMSARVAVLILPGAVTRCIVLGNYRMSSAMTEMARIRLTADHRCQLGDTGVDLGGEVKAPVVSLRHAIVYAVVGFVLVVFFHNQIFN
jgi:hypothetical protein